MTSLTQCFVGSAVSRWGGGGLFVVDKYKCIQV